MVKAPGDETKQYISEPFQEQNDWTGTERLIEQNRLEQCKEEEWTGGEQ